MPCHEVRMILPDYAAGAATPAECAMVDNHLRSGCEPCRHELDELMGAASLLLEAGPLLAPSPRLKADLLAALDAPTPAPLPKESAAAPVVNVAPEPKPMSWRQALPYLAAGIVVAAVGAGVLRWTLANSGVAGAVTADDWRREVAESQRVFGAADARLVSLPVGVFEHSLVTHVLYDSISEQLHVWAVHNPLAEDHTPNWAWVLDADGVVVAKGELRAAGPARYATVLDIASLHTDTVNVLLTVEPTAPESSPSDDVVEQGVLEVR